MVGEDEPGWTNVVSAIDVIVGERPTEYDARTIANVRELLELIRSENLPAPEVAPGYWPTFSITWNRPGAENLEIEVFEDHVEVYRFHDGRTDIWEEPHQPGSPFSAKLIAELPRT